MKININDYALIAIGKEKNKVERTSLFRIVDIDGTHVFAVRDGYVRPTWLPIHRIIHTWGNKPNGKDFQIAKQEFRNRR